MNLDKEKYEVFSKGEKSLWSSQSVQVFILCSLLVQILLTFFAVIRKRTANKLLIVFIWSLYLLADWIADFALGLLANSQGNDSDCKEIGVKIMASSSAGSKHANDKSTNANIRAFWAPFLLLHLGGPDTITAFAMEDNELWRRHLLGLLFEFIAAGYVFLFSLPMNELLIPTLLIFVAGIIKFTERTYSLYLASMDGFRDSMLRKPDPGPNYPKLMREYESKTNAGVPAVFDLCPQAEAPEKSPFQRNVREKMTAARLAFELFDTFKGLIVELMFSHQDRAKSRSCFLGYDANDAFLIIEYELEFIYEVLFTKGAVVHTKKGYVLRAVCSCSILTAFIFFFFTSKHEHDKLDVAISYTLLGGAIALDTLALFMLTTSDVALVKLSEAIPCSRSVVSWIIKSPPLKRWSESTTQYNLIPQCLPEHKSYFGRIADRPTCCGKISEAFYLQKVFNSLTWDMTADLFKKLQYTSRATVSREIKYFIFQQLKKKAIIMNEPNAARRSSSFRGSWVLEQRGYWKTFRESIDTDFDESLLVWHIATTLCYYTEEDVGKLFKGNSKAPDGSATTKPEDTVTPEDQKPGDEDVAVPISVSVHRRLSKQISDYMIYLLMMQPAMMSSAAVVERLVRFHDTREEAKDFFESLCKSGEDDDKKLQDKKLQEKLKIACNELLSVNTEVKPIEVKGDSSKSVLFDGCILAKTLKTELKVATRWLIMGEVWVEMLGHAAGRCNGIALAQGLGKGGELLTFVSFLMAHLGLGEKFRIQKAYTRTKLVVGK